MQREQVYKALDSERDYQDQRWGETQCGGKHSPTEYLVYMQDYINEAMHLVSRVEDPKGSEEAMNIIRKVTAMGVACAEQHGINYR